MISWHSFLAASLTMAVIGLVVFAILRLGNVHSWRLRSWVVGAVLLQGLMWVRAPVHVGLIHSPAVPPSSPIMHPRHRPTLPGLGSASSPTNDSAGMITPTRVAKATQDRGSYWLAMAERIKRATMRWNWLGAFFVVWLGVLIAMVAAAIYRYVRVLRLTAHLERAPDVWQRRWCELINRNHRGGTTARCEMLVSGAVGPLTVRRPTHYSLIVPEAYWRGLTDQQRHGVMLHELAHLQRGDVWRQLIARTIATIHWFNPIGWWAVRQYELAAECACDGRVAAGGKQASAGLASALVQLVQFHDSLSRHDHGRLESCGGIGVQAMATPPLNTRISRLLKPQSTGDSSMKCFAFTLLAIALVIASFFQIRLTTAQDTVKPGAGSLDVIDRDTTDRLQEIADRIDSTDPTSQRLTALLRSPNGQIAVAGYLNELVGRQRDAARSEAIPRFVDHHFARDDDGKLAVRVESAATLQDWIRKSALLAESIRQVNDATRDIAQRIDTSTEAGGLFKRLLEDPQAPVAVLMGEMEGGDVVARYLAKALNQILVDQGDGTFRIVQSKRREANEQIEKLELADKIAERLRRQLPDLAAEYADHDEDHARLVHYLKDPLTATVAALELSSRATSPSEAVERLHQQFEEVSIDTAKGLEIAHEEAWEHLEEVMTRVERASSILPRIQDKLAEFAETLDTDDPLTARMARQMNRQPVAVLLASELPYAEADPGEELKAMLSEVLTETGGKLTINHDREDEVIAKARELLQTCRKIRRYASNIDEMLDAVADRQFVTQLGQAGRYTLLDEVRRFAERHRPDPIDLMQDHLLVETDDDKLRVREDRREIVRQLVEQSDRIRAEAAKDDF